MFKKIVIILIYLSLCVNIGNCRELEPKTFIEYGNTLALRSEFKLAAEEYFRSFFYFPNLVDFFQALVIHKIFLVLQIFHLKFLLLTFSRH